MVLITLIFCQRRIEALAIKPSNLIYGLEEKPSSWITLFLGFQHICIYAISLSFPVIVVRGMGGTAEQAAFMISMSMIAGGIGTIALSLHKGPIGSGYLCPQVCSPTNLAAAILAAKTGSLSLICGMTFFSGMCEAFFSRVIQRLRALFPPEVTGLIVAMVGITVIRVASLNFIGRDSSDHLTESSELFVSILTLSTMIGLNIWSKGKLKLFCVLIGMIVGYISSYFFGLFGSSEVARVREANLFWFPFGMHPGWSFDARLIVIYIIAMLCSALKTVGDITTCQKINDVEWKRPDMKNISKGILADAVGDIASGILGGAGQSTSSSNVGLSIATGATSRVIAYAAGGLLIFLAFLPKVSSMFAIMPKPVIGSTLIFALTFMVIAGFQIIMSRMIDARKTFVVGVSFIFGLMVDIIPEAFEKLHPWIKPVFSSSLATATVLAIFLNLVFKIGIRKRVQLELTPGGVDTSEKIFTFMDQQGGLWGARKDVIQRAILVMNEFLESITFLGISKGKLKSDVSFDEFNLDIAISYEGKLMDFPDTPPSEAELLHDEEAFIRLSKFLIKKNADRIKSFEKEGTCQVQFHFDH
jgi:xanthine permease XanP